MLVLKTKYAVRFVLCNELTAVNLGSHLQAKIAIAIWKAWNLNIDQHVNFNQRTEMATFNPKHLLVSIKCATEKLFLFVLISILLWLKHSIDIYWFISLIKAKITKLTTSPIVQHNNSYVSGLNWTLVYLE